jgi:hypothetical protein
MMGSPILLSLGFCEPLRVVYRSSSSMNNEKGIMNLTFIGPECAFARYSRLTCNKQDERSTLNGLAGELNAVLGLKELSSAGKAPMEAQLC